MPIAIIRKLDEGEWSIETPEGGTDVLGAASLRKWKTQLHSEGYKIVMNPTDAEIQRIRGHPLGKYAGYVGPVEPISQKYLNVSWPHIPRRKSRGWGR